MTRRAVAAFWEKVDRSGECWLWTGYLNPNGYGQLWLPKPHGRTGLAHRYAYEQARGPIPSGLTIDHLCRNRACVNPAHMEPVTNRENILRGAGRSAVNARKTECPAGHTYSPATTYINPTTGKRRCYPCSLERMKRVRLARRLDPAVIVRRQALSEARLRERRRRNNERQKEPEVRARINARRRTRRAERSQA